MEASRAKIVPSVFPPIAYGRGEKACFRGQFFYFQGYYSTIMRNFCLSHDCAIVSLRVMLRELHVSMILRILHPYISSHSFCFLFHTFLMLWAMHASHEQITKDKIHSTASYPGREGGKSGLVYTPFACACANISVKLSATSRGCARKKYTDKISG